MRVRPIVSFDTCKSGLTDIPTTCSSPIRPGGATRIKGVLACRKKSHSMFRMALFLLFLLVCNLRNESLKRLTDITNQTSSNMTTTISVKFRPSTVAGKAGTVFYQVIHKRRMARINTDIHIPPQVWNDLNGQAEGVINQLATIVRRKIAADLSLAYGIIETYRLSGKEHSVKDLVETIKRRASQHGERSGHSSPTHHPPHPQRPSAETSFLSFMQKRIDELNAERRHGTAANYKHTLDSFSSFIEDCGVGRDVTFPMITDTLAEQYEAWLKGRSLKRNTTSFYMRILRAVYNLGVKRGITHQPHPFRTVYTGIDATRKRAVKEEDIVALSELDLRHTSKLQLAKDMFLFSFATCGMPFVDMAHLKHTDISDGYIRYERRKTGQPLQIKVLPIVQHIVNKYKCDDSPYVFPVFTSHETSEAYKTYRTALVVYNYRLHKISALLPDNIRLTSYVSRHSWATIARRHGNTAASIGTALGHTSEKTTQIYLASMENAVIDKMNEEILGCLQ